MNANEYVMAVRAKCIALLRNANLERVSTADLDRIASDLRACGAVPPQRYNPQCNGDGGHHDHPGHCHVGRAPLDDADKLCDWPSLQGRTFYDPHTRYGEVTELPAICPHCKHPTRAVTA